MTIEQAIEIIRQTGGLLFGKGEVESSILSCGTRNINEIKSLEIACL
jgi:hypothetical protein